MTDDSYSKEFAKPRSIGVGRTLLSVAMLFFPPAMAAASTLLTLPVFGMSARVYKPVFVIFVLLTLTSIFAVSASFGNPSSTGEAVKALKFFFMALCLVSGFWLKTGQKDIRRLALILSALLAVWYTISLQMGINLPEAFRPPDNNGSSILLFFLAFVLSEGRGLALRLALIVFLFFFATVVDSRLLIVLLPFFFISQPVSFSVAKVSLFICLCIGIYLWSMSAGLWGNWSDFVRLELYATTIRYFYYDPGLMLISNGPETFINEINKSLPLVISERLELKHAHNALFHVLGSYGLLAGLCFMGVFLSLVLIALKHSDNTLRNQTLFLISAMMIETLLTDSRIAYIVFLFIGLQIGSSRRRSVLLPRPASRRSRLVHNEGIL